jgi:Mlc titration factor MtfA (ptsG expression regulator)
MQSATLLTLLGLLALVGFVAWGAWSTVLQPMRRRVHARHEPFPEEWETILQREVRFYRRLSEEDKQRFRDEVQVFLQEKRITGIKTDIDDTTRVLAASSAIIPIFGFPGWEWNQVREILVYPTRFDQEDFEMGGVESDTLGMVGSGAMNGLMILSKPDLLDGFRNPRDKRNVGIHEFVHLLDKSDGAVDGVPELGLERGAIAPWLQLVRREMQRMRAGRSGIDLYGLTNEAEFFAVVSEYFFERPEMLEREHPELFAMLEKIFRQDMRSRAGSVLSSARSAGRNMPCPCGSGKRYRNCCRDG